MGPDGYARRIDGERMDSLLDSVDPVLIADIELADALVEGRLSDGQGVVFVIEGSWRAHSDEVDRAERRARALREAATPARGLVVSHLDPGEAVVSAATAQGVAVVSELDGLLTPGAPTAA